MSHPPLFIDICQGFSRPPTSTSRHGSHGRFFSHFFRHLFGRCLGHFGRPVFSLPTSYFAGRLCNAATRPAAFATTENIPAPRCWGKIPRRLGSLALIRAFICRGVRLPASIIVVNGLKSFAPGWHSGSTASHVCTSLFFLSCSHGSTSFYIRLYPVTFLTLFFFLFSYEICQLEQSFKST